MSHTLSGFVKWINEWINEPIKDPIKESVKDLIEFGVAKVMEEALDRVLWKRGKWIISPWLVQVWTCHQRRAVRAFQVFDPPDGLIGAMEADRMDSFLVLGCGLWAFVLNCWCAFIK